jgi:hypothetical protein
MHSFLSGLIASAIVLVSLTSFSHAGIDDCLEFYQKKATERFARIEAHNRDVDMIPYVQWVHPRDFKKMVGPRHYLNYDADYCLASACTLGALPVLHGVVKGGYVVSKYAISGVADTTVIPAINLGKVVEKTIKTKKRVLFYQREISLIKDLIQYDVNNFIDSPLLVKISNKKAIEKNYPNLRNVYEILKLAFESEYYCSTGGKYGDAPATLEQIIRDLKSGHLAEVVGYGSKDLSYPEIQARADSEAHDTRF